MNAPAPRDDTYSYLVTHISPDFTDPVSLDIDPQTHESRPGHRLKWNDGEPFPTEPTAPFRVVIEELEEREWPRHFRPIYPSPYYLMRQEINDLFQSLGISTYKFYPAEFLLNDEVYSQVRYVAFKMLELKGEPPKKMRDAARDLFFLCGTSLIVHESIVPQIRKTAPDLKIIEISEYEKMCRE